VERKCPTYTVSVSWFSGSFFTQPPFSNDILGRLCFLIWDRAALVGLDRGVRFYKGSGVPDDGKT
jgi:hypothetical protein